MTIRGQQLCSNANDVTIDAITMVWPWKSHERSKDSENRSMVRKREENEARAEFSLVTSLG